MNNKWKIGIIVFIALVVIVAGGWAFRWYTAPFKGKLQKREKVQSGDFRLYSYEHFYDMYADAKTYTQKIEIQKENLKTVENGSDEARKIRQNLNALQNKRFEVINEYNADARKEKSRGQFRANDLPYKLEIGDFK